MLGSVIYFFANSANSLPRYLAGRNLSFEKPIIYQNTEVNFQNLIIYSKKSNIIFLNDKHICTNFNNIFPFSHNIFMNKYSSF